MNALQYKIVKSVLNVGADPIKFAGLCNAQPLDFIAVQTTDNYNQYVETVMDNSPGTSAEDILNNAFNGGNRG